MIRSVLYLTPRSGGYAAVQRYFEQERVFEHAACVPGFLSAELHEPVDAGTPALVTASWDSPGAYRNWVADPWRASNAGNAKAIFEPVEVAAGGGSVYEVTYRLSVDGTSQGQGSRS